MLSKIIRVLSLMFLISIPLAAAGERSIPEPLPDHPGNIFLAGEDVSVRIHDDAAGDWKLVDYDGKVIREGRGPGRVQLGRLPVGYYELVREKKADGELRPFSIGVIARLKAPTPETSPVACDVGMAWSYGEKEMPVAANLCTLAGLNWVRDRFSWKELEPTPGDFPERSRYDLSAEVQIGAGLKVLQVNHNVPPWAWTWSYDQRGRFPADLRDAYNFYRRVAERWRGKVLAIEPWNEADAWDFGNHTGCEIATMQKASYLGLKAGNPSVIACQNAFASLRRPTTLGDFHANRAWPYFDTFNFHTYDPFFNYPGMGAVFRGVSAGRPMWLTEANKPVPFDESNKFREPSDENLRVQADRMMIIYALSFHEGSDLTFFFYLPEFGKKLQFGLLRPDFTPRPGFLALAAIGRLLADAKPLGRLNSEDKNLHAYAFRAKPDGQTRTVLVAWKKEKPTMLNLPGQPTAAYDILGRELPASKTVELTSSPITLVLSDDDAAKLILTPPPKEPLWLEGKPSPIVLQCLLPKNRVHLDKSAYKIARGKTDKIPIYVYNFGTAPADLKLTAAGPKDWKPTTAKSIRIAPGERKKTTLALDVPQTAEKIGTIRIGADCGPLEDAVLSMRFLPE